MADNRNKKLRIWGIASSVALLCALVTMMLLLAGVSIAADEPEPIEQGGFIQTQAANAQQAAGNVAATAQQAAENAAATAVSGASDAAGNVAATAQQAAENAAATAINNAGNTANNAAATAQQAAINAASDISGTAIGAGENVITNTELLLAAQLRRATFFARQAARQARLDAQAGVRQVVVGDLVLEGQLEVWGMVTLTLDSTGAAGIETSLTPEIPIPFIGTFQLGVIQPTEIVDYAAQQGVERTLTMRIDGEDYVYAIEDDNFNFETDVQINEEFQQITNIVYDDNNVLVVIDTTLAPSNEEIAQIGVEAVQEAAGDVADSVLPPLGPTGLIDVTDPRVALTANWRYVQSPEASEGGFYFNMADGEAIAFSFVGPTIDIAYVASSTFGAFIVEIDGEIIGTVPSFDSDVFLFDQVVTIGDLGPGLHSLRIIPVAGNVIGIDHFYVP
ncbi:MAG: hypothetical protein AAFV98_04015 [Chloroflexota bacterium]